MKTNYQDQEKYRQCLVDIGILLNKAASIFRLIEREHTKQDKLTSTQSFLLINLLDRGELPLNGIAQAMHLDKSSVTRIVMILIRDGLLKRAILEEDKRITLISLTPEGKHLAVDLKTKREQYYSTIIAHLPAGHVREVMYSAEILITALERTI